jgi:antitoxin (DNA-binding transcriptional repressor) of toxin-antitoxin stability system
MEQVSVEKLRSALGDYLDKVNFRRESFLVTRYGRPFVLLAPSTPHTEPTSLVNARAVRTNISDLLGQVYYQGVVLQIERRGKPVAVFARWPDGGN